MSLPKPSCSFVIPSVHDGLELDCRIYYPRRSEQNHELFGRTFAIFAHPYAPLGGCYDDPVVGLVGGILLRHSIVLVTFNFRGASGSAGRTSWSGKAELADYVSVYGFMLCCIDTIFRDVSRTDTNEDATMRTEALSSAQTNPSAVVSETLTNSPRPILILGGYSYGSMIAAHLPALEVVAGMFRHAQKGSMESEIELRARDLGRDLKAYLDMHSVDDMVLSIPKGNNLGHQDTPPKEAGSPRSSHSRSHSRNVTMGGYDSDVASKKIGRESTSRRSVDGERMKEGIDKFRRKLSQKDHRIRSPPSIPDAEPSTQATDLPLNLPGVAYVLVSPLLSTVAGFTTMFSKLKFEQGTTGGKVNVSDEYQELIRHPCCCIYGSKDVFTSDRKLRRWSEELTARPGSRFVAVRAETGHFWQDAEGVVRLKHGLTEWLRGSITQYANAAKGKEDDTASTATTGVQDPT
ncbi:uncharacterized protein PV06_05852 [Exophiala oligosperma]|uniref:AB hydrolase-1 domain-containing protein n=2 Tax=Exophiala oligosperma TaxID=215243 RepID=A0A0D2E3B5_9EURO|nr:uncharacterized protein PV06_05852 [Exophiala oligosperma]KIW42289.1 hypothetical protein PV06_05852 [Exophiala oligosperma]